MVRVPLQSLKFHISRLFRARSSWHSGNHRAWIHSETRTWHNKNIQSYSRIFRILFIPDIFRILVHSYHKAYSGSRYIHNTILNIFTKASSWTFDIVLNAPLFYRCYLTSRVTLPYLYVMFQTYSDTLKTYSATFSLVKAQ